MFHFALNNMLNFVDCLYYNHYSYKNGRLINHIENRSITSSPQRIFSPSPLILSIASMQFLGTLCFYKMNFCSICALLFNHQSLESEDRISSPTLFSPTLSLILLSSCPDRASTTIHSLHNKFLTTYPMF